MTTTRVLWFSRHTMTVSQRTALETKLGNIEITQVNGNLPNIHVPFDGEINGQAQTIQPFKNLMAGFDVIAIVAPIGLQQQIVQAAGDTPVIVAQNERKLVKTDGGEDGVVFNFNGWHRIEKIEVVTSHFA